MKWWRDKHRGYEIPEEPVFVAPGGDHHYDVVDGEYENIADLVLQLEEVKKPGVLKPDKTAKADSTNLPELEAAVKEREYEEIDKIDQQYTDQDKKTVHHYDLPLELSMSQSDSSRPQHKQQSYDRDQHCDSPLELQQLRPDHGQGYERISHCDVPLSLLQHNRSSVDQKQQAYERIQHCDIPLQLLRMRANKTRPDREQCVYERIHHCDIPLQLLQVRSKEDQEQQAYERVLHCDVPLELMQSRQERQAYERVEHCDIPLQLLQTNKSTPAADHKYPAYERIQHCDISLLELLQPNGSDSKQNSSKEIKSNHCDTPLKLANKHRYSI